MHTLVHTRTIEKIWKWKRSARKNQFVWMKFKANAALCIFVFILYINIVEASRHYTSNDAQNITFYGIYVHWVPGSLFKHYFILMQPVSKNLKKKSDYASPMKAFTLTHTEIYQYMYVCIQSFYIFFLSVCTQNLLIQQWKYEKAPVMLVVCTKSTQGKSPKFREMGEMGAQ